MTNTKWLAAVLTLFVVCTLWCGVCEGSYLAGTNVASRLQYFMTWPGWTGLLGWVVNFFGILLFDYSFFHGDWLIVKYALFMPLGVAMIVSYAALLVPYLLTAVRSLAGVAASFLGLGGGA
jgi:hypothetical protein